ncbi:MAG: methyltransferase domain-containing protein [Candidatus Accumulibacter sp. UW25]|jgi:predicted SAM-dependent methyltransferase
MKLNLGCGSQVVDGWVNVDYSIGARAMKIPFFSTLNKRLKLFNLDWNEKIYLHDLTKRLPWLDSSVDVIYSSHTLEHFTKDEGRSFLAECHRVLRRDGIIRIVVPDLRHYVDKYIKGHIRADDIVKRLGVLYGSSDNRIKKTLSPFFQFPHKCMYDKERLVEIVDEVGFNATSKQAFCSGIEDIQVIEVKERTKTAVIVEGRKRL